MVSFPFSHSSNTHKICAWLTWQGSSDPAPAGRWSQPEECVGLGARDERGLPKGSLLDLDAL